MGACKHVDHCMAIISLPIDAIKSQFKGEWLLIAIDSVDEKTTTPLTGHILAHSPAREEIHKASLAYSGLAAVYYSDDWPEDLAACFFLV